MCVKIIEGNWTSVVRTYVLILKVLQQKVTREMINETMVLV